MFLQPDNALIGSLEVFQFYIESSIKKKNESNVRSSIVRLRKQTLCVNVFVCVCFSYMFSFCCCLFEYKYVICRMFSLQQKKKYNNNNITNNDSWFVWLQNATALIVSFGTAIFDYLPTQMAVFCFFFLWMHSSEWLCIFLFFVHIVELV